MCLFGRPIRDFIPILPDKYLPHPTWQSVIQDRETALRRRHMAIAEKLTQHSRRLPPLQVGDCVRIQNQTGIYPRRWDRTGSVVEVRQYDQYVIRVDGSGRVTLRNRKSLRKFNPVRPDTPFDRLIQAWQQPAAPDIPLPHQSTSNDTPQVNKRYPDTPDSDILPLPASDIPPRTATTPTTMRNDNESQPDKQQLQPADAPTSPPSATLRRSTRERRQPDHLADYVLN